MSSLFDDIDLCIKIYKHYPNASPNSTGLWSCEVCDDEHLKLNGPLVGDTWWFNNLNYFDGHIICDYCCEKMAAVAHDFICSQKEESGGS